jgi:thiamine biosynthesis lipoprotein
VSVPGARALAPGIRLALEAMATRFELLILDPGEVRRLRAAGEEALGEIARAERLWSRFLPTSEISWLNAAAGGRPVPVSSDTFALLARSVRLARASGFAFDPTVGPLLRVWGIGGPRPRRPPGARERERALRLVGADKLELDEARQTARLCRRGMQLDLGAIGKGAAVDRAVALLRDLGIRSALLHGGTSSVRCLGRPLAGGWRVAWRGSAGETLAPVELDERRPALSVSAPRGRRVAAGAAGWGHVVDPRSGEPIPAGAALVAGPDAAGCDALSTAALVHGAAGLERLAANLPEWELKVALDAGRLDTSVRPSTIDSLFPTDPAVIA